MVISVFSIYRANDVVDCIKSLKKQSLPPKAIIIVLDPNDNLIDYYRKRLDTSVKIVISDTFGLSAARNKGIMSSNTTFIAFIDDDAVADRDWLRKLVGNFDDPSVMGVGGQIIPSWPDNHPSWFPDELFWVVGCSYKGLPRNKAPIRNPIGCNMAFRRIAFEKAGYFSAETGRIGNKLMGHDDTEIGIRITNKIPGTIIIYDPEAIVYHRVSRNRVSINYLLKRSYSEGYSKALISTNGKNLGTEKSYLHNLIMDTPKILVQGNILTGTFRCVVLWTATMMVFLGYIAGSKSI